MFMGQYLKGNNMAPKKIIMVDNAHAKTSNASAYIKIQLNLQERSWDSSLRGNSLA